MLRTIQIVPSIAGVSSGPSYSVRRLTECLRAQGFDARIAALEFGGEPALGFLKLFSIGTGPTRLGRSRDMFDFLENQAELSRGNLVLHSHGMWQMNAVYPGWIARRANVPLVVSPRGAFSSWAMANGNRLKRIFWSLVQRRALEAASCFHATSEAELDDIRRLGFRQPVAVVPNGIDLPDLYQQSSDSDTCTLLFLGRLHPVKGIDMLLEAWARLEGDFPRWSLTIAGSDHGYYGKSGYASQVAAMADALKIDRVRFIGEQNATQKADLYAAANLYVLPSRSENFAVTVAEALAAGVPAVVTRGAPWSQLETEGAGWWVETEIDSLENGLRSAMSLGSDGLRSMGRQARAWMERDFSWEYVAGEMAGVYRWLIDQTGPIPSCVQT